MRMTLPAPKTKAKTPKQEVKQLHAAARRVIASKELSLRFLAATGMYTASGEIKPQFR